MNNRKRDIFRIEPQAKGYRNDQITPLYQQLSERIEAIPGVRAVTISEFAALSGEGRNGGAYVDGGNAPEATGSTVYQQRVRWNYLGAMEIPLVAGRGLTPQDDERAPRVAVINQTMARRFFGEENPIGRRFGFQPANSTQIEVVGVARDSRYLSPRRDVPPIAYLPYSQYPLSQTTFTVRTTGDPKEMIAAIRAAAREVDKDLPVFAVKTQRENTEQVLAQERFFPRLTGFFALLALLLSAIGIYGVMAYAVARRTGELGIRLALGAEPGDLLRMVLRESMLLVAIGAVLGLGAALSTMRVVSSMLYGLTASDPATISVAVAVLLTVALLAAWLPARRAAAVDPLVALRDE